MFFNRDIPDLHRGCLGLGPERSRKSLCAIRNNAAVLRETCHSWEHFPLLESSGVPTRLPPLSEVGMSHWQPFPSPP